MISNIFFSIKFNLKYLDVDKIENKSRFQKKKVDLPNLFALRKEIELKTHQNSSLRITSLILIFFFNQRSYKPKV